MFKHMIFSDGWFIENNEAFFLSSMRNYLYKLDLKFKNLTCLSRVPSIGQADWRLNPTCFRRGKYIYCLPDRGTQIWQYNLENDVWKNIPIPYINSNRLRVNHYFFYKEKAFLYSIGAKAIFEFDCNEGKILSIIQISDNEDEVLGLPAIKDHLLYIVSKSMPCVYFFDFESGIVRKTNVSGMKYGSYLICPAGESFYLSGCYRGIVKWDERNNTIKKIPFPAEVGVYDVNGTDKSRILYEDTLYDVPMFLTNVIINGRIWFVPFRANHMLRLDTNNDELCIFYINEEEETEQTMKRLWPDKFFLEYIRDDRYIGIYSFKNEWIYEVDTRNVSYDVIELNYDISVINNIKNELLKPSYIIEENGHNDVIDFINNIAGKTYPNGNLKDEALHKHLSSNSSSLGIEILSKIIKS